jgi:prepilin-type processing-associated H-X9-DG protein
MERTAPAGLVLGLAVVLLACTAEGDDGGPGDGAAAFREAFEQPDLSGPWRLTISLGEHGPQSSVDLSAEYEPWTGRIEFSESASPGFVGTVDGRSVKILRAPGQIQECLLGALSDDFARIEAELVQPPPDMLPPGVQMDEHDLKKDVRFIFERLTDEVRQREAQDATLKEERRRFMEELVRGFTNYLNDHDGLPPELSALAPRYVDAALLEEKSGCTLAYEPYEVAAFDANPAPPASIELFGMPLEDVREHLMAVEAARKQAGYERLLFPKPFLTAQWDEPTQVLWAAATDRDIRVVEPPTDELGRADVSALARCQNHLKQLGVIVTMFAGENRGYTPPGWCVLYPDYLSDPSILTCPKDPPGTESYIYLQSAKRWEDLLAEDPSLQQDEVPLMVDRYDHIHAGSTVRNVLFWDGHVEVVRVDSEQWNEQIAPWTR